MDAQRDDTAVNVVAYFFEYLGVLVAYKLVPQEFVIDFSANLIIRSWSALKPFIEAERTHRNGQAVGGVSPGFVSHFEHLVAITVDESGKGIDGLLHQKIGLKPATNFRFREDVAAPSSEAAPAQRTASQEEKQDSP